MDFSKLLGGMGGGGGGSGGGSSTTGTGGGTSDGFGSSSSGAGKGNSSASAAVQDNSIAGITGQQLLIIFGIFAAVIAVIGLVWILVKK